MGGNRKHITFFAWCCLVFSLLVAGKFFYIQIIQGEYYREKAVKQRVRVIEHEAQRGNIYDRNGIKMATNLTSYNIAIYPNLITSADHKEKVAFVLTDILGLDEEKIWLGINKVDEKGNPSLWHSVKKRVDYATVQALKKEIEDKSIGGIEITPAQTRYYSQHSLASGLLGFVNHEKQPYAGLELSLNSYLQGVSGYNLAEMDRSGKIILPTAFENSSSPLDGESVTLTIDTYIQYVLEKRLAQAMEEMDPVSAHGIVMDPNSGEIYAMATLPSFDPNNYTNYDAKTWSLNPATYTYEPGSTFKPIYMAMALDQGAIHEHSSWYDELGYIRVHGAILKNWDGVPLGQMSLEDIIVHSSNVGMVEISRRMSPEAVLEGLEKAGFGDELGLLLREEAAPLPSVQALKNDPQRQATISFGQGISVTPLQLTAAFSEIINGGRSIKPHLVKKIEDQFQNISYAYSPPVKEKIYQDQTVDLIKTYLRRNMEVGSGDGVQLDGHVSGGKTGSSWKVEAGQYKDGAIIGSFIGFAPYENPRFVVLIVIDEPQGAEFGSEAAGPIYQDVMKEVLRYQGVPNEDTNAKSERRIDMPDVRWLTFDDAKKLIEDQVKYAFVLQDGNGSVVTDMKYRYRNHQLYVTLETRAVKENEQFYVPDLHGKTKEEVERLTASSGIAIRFFGEGQVREQSISPGKHANITAMKIWLQ